jgi:hypothetical protein
LDSGKYGMIVADNNSQNKANSSLIKWYSGINLIDNNLNNSAGTGKNRIIDMLIRMLM